MKQREYYRHAPYIHYSNCHEDTDFVLGLIDNRPKRILTIASALDNVLAMLLLDPEEILAVDYNPAQIALCRLKLCAIRQLSYEEVLTLLGFSPGDSGACYDRLRPALDRETRRYFDENRFLITEIRLVNCGQFEYYFSVFRSRILPLVHTRKRVDAFLEAPTLAVQRERYRRSFNSPRFRLMFKLFFSQPVMKRIGRDKAYFKYSTGSLSALQKARFDQCAANNLNRENPYLQYILRGRFSALPCWLRPENYDRIRSRLDRITLRCCDFEAAVSEGGAYDLIYLSDIYEYLDETVMDPASGAIARALTETGIALLFNMMNTRRLGKPLAETEVDQTRNRTFYYKACYLYRRAP